MRNFSLGVGRRDLILFVLGGLIAVGLTIVWDLFLIDLINRRFPESEQAANKYILTALIILPLAALVALVSLILSRRGAEQDGRRRSPVAGFMVRFGLALQLFGILIMPIGLYYATNPTRSVPVGFAAFTAGLLGLFIAGFGGNMLLPRRV